MSRDPVHFVAELSRELDDEQLGWMLAVALALGVKSLALLAAGVAYRAPALLSRRMIVAGAGLAVLLALRTRCRRAGRSASRRPGSRGLGHAAGAMTDTAVLVIGGIERANNDARMVAGPAVESNEVPAVAS